MDVQSVRLDTIQDVQLIIGEKKTIAMAEDADISWTKEDEIEVNGRSSNSTYKSRIDADVTYSTLLVLWQAFVSDIAGWHKSVDQLRYRGEISRQYGRKRA